MINNQIQSPVTGKNSAISGQSSEESKREAGKQQGGLFKLLMSSMQAGDQAGKKGNSGAANILGGNLTLNTSKEGKGDQSALHLLAESGEGSKEEKITLSKLLEGSESTVESNDDDASVKDVSAQEATNRDKDSSENGGQEVVSEDSAAAVEKQSDSGTAETSAGTSVQAAPEAQGNVDGNSAQATSNSNTELHESVKAAGDNSGTSGEQTADSGKISAQQQAAALSGDALAAGAGAKGSNQQATAGETKEANSLNGLMGGLKTSENGTGSLFTGEKVAEGKGLTHEGGRGESNNNIRPELIKSEGFVNELRALAAAQGEQFMAGQEGRHVPAEHMNESAATGDGKLIQEIFSALQNGSIEQVAAEIRSLKASQLRETRYSNYMSSFAHRQEISDSGSAFSSGSESSTTATAAGSTATMMPLSAVVPTGATVSSEMFDENGAALWKEQITEYFESNEKSAAENQAAAAFARLGDVPVTNISVRRSFAQGISQAIMNAAGDGKKGSDVWQKHNFVLEDGKNIQVSAREVDGVLQLRLSSSYSELNKLLMEHENEIRDLLENELELKINLQMDGGAGGSAADFFGGSSRQQSGSDNGPLDLGSLKKTKEQTVDEVVPKAVRKFGYNQMEWTV